MNIELSGITKSLEAMAYGLWRPFLLWPAAYGFWRPLRRGRKGQATVEYLLMLAVVVGATLIVGIFFHRRILGGIFSLIGMALGAGKTTTP